MRLNEYIQAVNAGEIPSYAPAGATAPPQAQFFEAAHGASTNNYARADGQARARRAKRAQSRSARAAGGHAPEPGYGRCCAPGPVIRARHASPPLLGLYELVWRG